MKADARHIALEILLRCQKKTCPLDKALADFQADLNALSQKDRNLCHALVFGVLRHRENLDHTIRAFSKIPFGKVEPRVRFILRMGLYQLNHMDKIPDFAAINTSVDLAKAKAGRKTGGFVNGVLRSAAKNRTPLPLPDPAQKPAHHLGVAYSMPVWLVKRWLETFGQEKTESLCRSVNRVPPITLRTNTLKTNREQLGKRLEDAGFDCCLTGRSPEGIRMSGPGIPIHELPGFPEGLFQVQDEAAQAVTRLLSPQPGESVLDACAGLGGKTLHMAQLMENRGRIIAMDRDGNKLDSLMQEAGRLGVNIITPCPMDLRKASSKDFPALFDRVLVDAPCTGLGVLRRNPDTKWKRTYQDILRMAGQQKKLLNAAANLARPGGVLVFAVCSCEPEETHGVVETFLAKRKDFQADPDHDLFNTYPDTPDLDGFFAARFLRR